MTPPKGGSVIPKIEGGEHFAYLLERALEQVIGDRSAEVLDRALDRAGEQLPASRVAFLAFVSGTLYDVVEAALDVDAADEVTSLVCEKIDRWMRHNTSEAQLTEPPPSTLGEVLIVDDEPLVITALRRLLESAGFEVSCAANGEEALALCAKHCPALVVTDFDMPLMSGTQLASLIRMSLGDDAPPIILLTGSDAAPSVHEDFFSVLMKPVDSATLLTAIGKALSDRS